MRNPEYSTVDPQTGNVTYRGPLQIMKGDHSNMPPRTEAYLPGDERGHVNASSLGGTNGTSNVVAQHSDVNHGGYLAVENGERSALQNGAVIDSEKTAFVNGQDRPTAFLVNDTITYPDGHTETVHHSFANESYASQAEWNEMSAALPGAFDAPNPGDGLRDSMSTAEYEALPDIQDAYAPADFSGVPDSTVEAESMADAGSGMEADSGASAEADEAASDSDASADADPE